MVLRKVFAVAVSWWLMSPLAYGAAGCPNWENYAAVRGRSYADSNINPQYGDVITGIGWTSPSPAAAFKDADTTVVFKNDGWLRVSRVISFSNMNEAASNADSVGGYVITQWRTPPGNWTRLDSVLISNSTVTTDSILVRNYEQMRFVVVALAAKLPDTLAGQFSSECCLVNIYPEHKEK